MVRRSTRKRNSASSASPSGSGSTGSTSSSVNCSHPRFGQQLDRNGVVFARSRVSAPADLDELLQDLNRRRESKSPSECEYRAYLEVVDTSYNEDTLTRAFDSIAKVQQQRPPAQSDGDRRYVTVYNMQWTEANAALQDGLSNPKPDVMECFTTESYPTDALHGLGGALAPTKHPPAMPAFVVHAKGPNGYMDEAEKQCAYDGAVMVHSAFEAHNYLAQPPAAFHSHTQALTVAFNGEDLHIYANHRTNDGKYHSYPVAAEKPRFSLAKYRVARRQLRNAQDWGRRRAERTRKRLWTKSRRDAALEAQCACKKEEEEEEEEEPVAPATPIAGIITPPPSSTGRKKTKRESTPEPVAICLSSASSSFTEVFSTPPPASPLERFYSPEIS